jgi:hypothetical protein
LSCGVRSLQQAPWWNADRRARCDQRAPRRSADRGLRVCRRSAFLLSFFLLGFAGLDRDERPDSTAGFAPRSLESKRFVPFLCRLPQTSDAGRIARTMVLGLAASACARGGRRRCRPNGFACFFCES